MIKVRMVVIIGCAYRQLLPCLTAASCFDFMVCVGFRYVLYACCSWSCCILVWWIWEFVIIWWLTLGLG